MFILFRNCDRTWNYDRYSLRSANSALFWDFDKHKSCQLWRTWRWKHWSDTQQKQCSDVCVRNRLAEKLEIVIVVPAPLESQGFAKNQGKFNLCNVTEVWSGLELMPTWSSIDISCPCLCHRLLPSRSNCIDNIRSHANWFAYTHCWVIIHSAWCIGRQSWHKCMYTYTVFMRFAMCCRVL